MAGVTVHVCPSPEHIGPLAADRLVAAVQKRPGAYLGMATGSTPKVTGFWSELQRRTAEGLDLSQVTFVNPDEWIGLGSGHPEAYRSYLTTELTNHFPTKILVPDGDAAEPIAAATAVEEAIVRGGGFEWTLLGMGINGHIGFFEPDADGLPSGAFTPAIDEVNRRRYATENFETIEQVPTHATTIGLGTVMRSRELCLVVVGEAKAALLAQALSGPVTTLLPASLIQLSTNVHVFLDVAAARLLDLGELSDRPGWDVIRHGDAT